MSGYNRSRFAKPVKRTCGSSKKTGWGIRCGAYLGPNMVENTSARGTARDLRTVMLAGLISFVARRHSSNS